MIEPPVWDPRAARHIPAATAAAEPLEDPPGVLLASQGFIVAGGSSQAYAVVTVLPRITAPAARRLATISASRTAARSDHLCAPAAVGCPATSMISFTPIGTP